MSQHGHQTTLMPSNVFDRPLLQFLQYLNCRPISRLVHVQLGVWDVVVRKPDRTWVPSLPTSDYWKEQASNASLAWRFMKEIHALAPRQFWMHAINGIWLSFEDLLSTYTSDRVYNAVISHLYAPNSDIREVCYAVAAQVGFIVARRVLQKLMEGDEMMLRERITYHFLIKSMITSLHNETKSKTATSPSNHGTSLVFPIQDYGIIGIRWSHQYDCDWHKDSFANFLHIQYSSTPSYGAGIPIRQHPSSTFCARVYLSFMGTRILLVLFQQTVQTYDGTAPSCFFGYNDTDIKSDGAGEYVVTQYERSRKQTGDICSEDVFEQWYNAKPLGSAIYHDSVQILPKLYFALRLIFHPKSLTPSSYAQLQAASSAIYSSMITFTYETRDTQQTFSNIRDIYQEEADCLAYCSQERQLLPYPRNGEEKFQSGMAIEFRDVSFCYPGAERNALSNISFTIKPGQLVAIVGVNGSGKSSITNLFNRLYDPTEGKIFVDGLPISSYRRVDVRRSMAILRQSHILYPLSIRENIALGVPEKFSSDGDIKAALECGGASSIVEKLPDKLDTELTPIGTVRSTMASFDDPALGYLKAIKDAEIPKDVSGSEGQRLAASRTFLRLRDGGIRFLAADEPTSALDPQGEFELFTRLKQQRGDMTVVLVTHRFGHVTKNADLILCMKDGCLVEQGTHEELVEKGEEYYRLYEIQAQAFSVEAIEKNAHIEIRTAGVLFLFLAFL